LNTPAGFRQKLQTRRATSPLTLFRGYYAQDPRAEFVIESVRVPRLGVMYNWYRCAPIFERLTNWLRTKGLRSAQPVHELRKAFGSGVCARAGIHQASRSLRHSDIRVTSAVYVDSRSKVSVGLGHLLNPPTNIVPIDEPEHGERKTAR